MQFLETISETRALMTVKPALQVIYLPNYVNQFHGEGDLAK